eukprot:CAMPEP_0114534134 /NCGR_PEP_ID=MMETSP0109-20121206/27669_1 /TAXON_ID=29199 /ORGANISM="Chlorarachnion reptans, Strain CCCM449" /LENGTH=91 /DNA_ID=CAMNT_0001717509 /DNA_START=321 /DNA_END=596 /DNA_ORIENTATION=+
MKQALPANAKVAKEAKDCIQECVTEFIGFITSEAADRLAKEDRKTITENDLVDSMRALGFNEYLAFLQIFIEKRRKSKGGDSASKKRKLKN